MLRFAALPEVFERELRYERMFAERQGAVWYASKDRVNELPEYSIRLNGGGLGRAAQGAGDRLSGGGRWRAAPLPAPSRLSFPHAARLHARPAGGASRRTRRCEIATQHPPQARGKGGRQLHLRTLQCVGSPAAWAPHFQESRRAMSLVLAAALAASAGSLPVCSWDRPGHNPFMGDTVAAVDRYADIPAPVRAALKRRMAARQYDEVATIRRDSIEGRYSYGDLRDMHFGQGQVCRTVTRDKWAPGAVERGLVYCESEHCLIVPTVCRNVSRVTRAPQPPAAAAGTGAGAAPGAEPATAAAPAGGAGPESSEPSFARSGAGSPSFADLSRVESTAGFGQPARSASVALSGAGFDGSVSGLPRSSGASGGLPALALAAAPIAPAPLMPAPLVPVPEPSTCALMALGVGLLALRVRRARSAAALARI